MKKIETTTGGGGVINILNNLFIEIRDQIYNLFLNIYNFEPSIEILVHCLIIGLITAIFIRGSNLIYKHNKIKRKLVASI